MKQFRQFSFKRFNINPKHKGLKVHKEVIAYYKKRQGRTITDVTHLLPEAMVPIALEQGLLAAMETTEDFEGHVFDAFNMSVNSPVKFQIDYNTFFRMALIDKDGLSKEVVVAATQFGFDPCVVFALAEDSCQWADYKNHPKVKKLFEKMFNEFAYMERDQLRSAQQGLPSVWSDDVVSVAITGRTIEQRLRRWMRDPLDWAWFTS